jgi:hypothetical protein
MLSNGRDSAEQANSRQMVVKGYAMRDPGFIIVYEVCIECYRGVCGCAFEVGCFDVMPR